ncbi:18304_t:CDS:2 [Dentiscutata erythropus]|uniref:18304_t:CDS:1 n=1 Tax=Dentiscutata erythropus TaxID=1348616 RepID=A0A9N9HYS8_9GLOM|nr:18304_t:CDS:2 [Dentiscutata erythropus]
MPSPGRHCNKITMPVVFLPTSFSYASVYRDYVQAYKDKHGKDVHVLAELTFTNIWKFLMPSLQFMFAKTDLCETCKTMKMEIQYATQHEKKLELTHNYLAHLNRAQKECNYYNANIMNAIEDSKQNPNITKSHILFKTFNGSAHIAYDWAQNVQVPFSPQQIGSLYFKSSRKVHLFGVCNTGNFPHTQQTNYIIDEAEMPDDGKQGFQYYDFKNYFQTFKKLPNIQKYHHFYFSSQYPGIVFHKDDLKDNYNDFIIRSFSFNANTLPAIIGVRPLSLKRQEELHKEIALYVDLPFCDITCPKP